MTDTTLNPAFLPAIHAAIQSNELGLASPYALSFARLGRSGASFGVFQGDTNVSQTARTTLETVLRAVPLPDATVERIMAALSQACPNGNPLSAQDSAAVAKALDAPAGRAAVDAMDNVLFEVVHNEVSKCVAAATAARLDIAPVAQLYIALWTNMTGQPSSLLRWLGGAEVDRVAPPTGPTVSEANVVAYLQASPYFTLHPRNFQHMHDSVAGAVHLLPV